MNNSEIYQIQENNSLNQDKSTFKQMTIVNNGGIINVTNGDNRNSKSILMNKSQNQFEQELADSRVEINKSGVQIQKMAPFKSNIKDHDGLTESQNEKMKVSIELE